MIPRKNVVVPHIFCWSALIVYDQLCTLGSICKARPEPLEGMLS